MKILFVAMSDSIHAVRWINQVHGQGWDVHLFPSMDYGVVHKVLKNTTVHHSVYAGQHDADPSVIFTGRRIGFLGNADRHRKMAASMRKRLESRRPNYRVKQLVELIRTLKPDIVHSLEFQHSGYLTLAAREEIERDAPGTFPTWIVTNWGSDIYLFGRLEGHQAQIKRLLEVCDFYGCECERDIELARDMGFKGGVLPVLPNSGGFDLEYLSQFRSAEPPSQRKIIVLKGYQHWAGRALCGLRAIELCADVLRDYRIVVYSAFPEVQIAAELISGSTGLQIEMLPWGSAFEDMLRLFGRARIYLGLSISDGVSISSLEAVCMGAFPIQSYTSCLDEYLADGECGLLVPPEDPQIVADALRRAVTDDELVDRAAEKNAEMCAKRLDASVARPLALQYYLTAAQHPKPSRQALTFSAPSQPAPRDPNRPMVSILTPTYNRADLLRETLDSVLAQTYPNIEYLVLDDGSKDNTCEVLAEYDGRLRWETHTNMGETRTVNKGWHMLSGDYLMVVNSDDPILPTLVETAVNIMEANPDLLLVYPDWYIINERSEIIGHQRAWDADYAEMVRVSSCHVGPGALMRRRVLELEPERDTSYRYVADYEYWLRVGRHGPFQRIPEYLATHRHHSESAGVSQGEAIAKELIALMHRYFAQPNLPANIRAVRRDSLAATYYDAAHRCNNNRRLKVTYGLKALGYRPRVVAAASKSHPQGVRHPSLYTIAHLFWPRWMKTFDKGIDRVRRTINIPRRTARRMYVRARTRLHPYRVAWRERRASKQGTDQTDPNS